MNTATIAVGLLVTSALALGCAVEAGSSEEAPAKAEQSLASFGLWSWGCSSNPCAITLMTAEQGANQAACFLAGLTGSLRSTNGAYSEVSVQKVNGQWGLQIVTNEGRPLGGSAVCIPTGAEVPQTFTLPSGQSQVSLGSGLTRRCFLSGLRSTNAFTAWEDYVHVHQERDRSWALTSNQSSKDLVASAICVNVPTGAPEVEVTAAGGTWPPSVDIQSNNPSGWACGLTKLRGMFGVKNLGEGAWIDYRAGSSMWQLQVNNGRTAAARCVK